MNNSGRISLVLSLLCCSIGVYTGDLDACFDCICRNKIDCGITYQFWVDAGKPGDDYHLCMQDTVCPRYAMEQYYIKFQQDCNGDGDINCFDYARIHILGGYGCASPENYELQKINKCLY